MNALFDAVANVAEKLSPGISATGRVRILASYFEN